MNDIYVIGDSHIGLAEGGGKEINRWLDRLAARAPKALYLNGDLFHYLIAHPKFKTASIVKVMEKFREIRDGGIPIHYVEGNRDFFIQGSFVEEAVTDIGLEYAVPAGANRYLIVHGDMINDRDWQYRFWRRASKNALTKLGINFIPGKMARDLVDDMEARLSRTNFKHKTRIPIERLEAYGRNRARDGFTHVVLGHFHEKLVLHASPSITVAVLPAWYEAGEAMRIDAASGEFEFVVV